LLVVAAGLNHYWLSPTPPFTPRRIVSIRRGESFRVIASRLADQGVIRSQLALIIWARLSGGSERVKPGDYAFKGGERVPDILRHLVNGDFMVVSVTVPEGLTLHQIGERLAQEDLGCGGGFDFAARRGPLIKSLGLGALGAEGYLFPATYRFSPLATTDSIVAAMLMRFYEILTPEVEQRMFELGIDARELVTLASMIEKEAKEPAERPIIASVFYNRLRIGMPLQSDPTAQYSFGGEISPAAIAVHTPSPFNTYSIRGLPPGPIANPGLSSIQAALHPAATDYLYFVARSDGTHVFSRSFAEHRRAIAAMSAGGASSKSRRIALGRRAADGARAGRQR
jgi:UPF0755 protein